MTIMFAGEMAMVTGGNYDQWYVPLSWKLLYAKIEWNSDSTATPCLAGWSPSSSFKLRIS